MEKNQFHGSWRRAVAVLAAVGTLGAGAVVAAPAMASQATPTVAVSAKAVKNVKLHFYDDVNDTTSTDAEYPVGSPLIAWPSNPSREGYTFEGYKVYDSNGDLKGGPYATPADMFVGLNACDSAAACNTPVFYMMNGWKFVGEWKANSTSGDGSDGDNMGVAQYNLVVSSNGGEFTAPADYAGQSGDASVQVAEGANLNQALDSFSLTRDGYTFKGWKYTDTNTDKDGKLVSEADTMPAADLYKIKAVWEKNAPEVQWATATFYDEDSATVLGTADYQVGESLGFWAVTPAPRAGYTFKGYAIKGKATAGVVDPATVSMSATGMAFVAVWEKDSTSGDGSADDNIQIAKVNVAFQDGYTGAVLSNQEATSGDMFGSVSKFVAKPSRDGYTFQGWSLTPNGEVLAGSYMLTADVTVYAVWQQNSTSGDGSDEDNMQVEQVAVTFKGYFGTKYTVKADKGTTFGEVKAQLPWWMQSPRWYTGHGRRMYNDTKVTKDMTVYARVFGWWPWMGAR